MKPKKFFASIPTVKKIDEKARTIEHIISTGSEDHDGDTINPKGWILDEYLKNPVVLFGHRHDLPPVARAIKLKASEKGLEALTQFPPKGISDLADTVFELNRLGFLRSWSVGFNPEKFNAREDGGIDFEEQKLLEYSSVPVPANAEAVNLAVSKGIMTEKMLEVFKWQDEHWKQCKLSTLFAVDEKPPLDIDIEKLQSSFVNGNAALQISGAHHARNLGLRKIISAPAGK